MPWSHCENAFLLDDEDCPDCGFTKAEWTVELETTRTFQVRRGAGAKKSWLDLEVVGADGQPLAGSSYRVTLPDGSVREGTLDDDGRAREERVPPGACQLVVS